MKKLTDFSDNEIFYRGTIVVLKNAHKSPVGDFDIKYCMLSGYGGVGNLAMLDLYKSIGGIIIHDIKPNVEGHHGVNKQGIRDWVDAHFRLFCTPEGYDEWSKKIDDITYIEDLSDYFVQANRDLFMRP